MYYKKQQNKMEEDTHKQIMYNRKFIGQPQAMWILSPWIVWWSNFRIRNRTRTRIHSTMEYSIQMALHVAGIRDMDYHFQTLKEMSQRITLRLDRAARAMDEVNKANVSPLASGSRSDRDSD